MGNPTDSPDGTYRHGLLVFKIDASCKLKLVWQKTVGNGGLSGSPVTANGVVYFGDASGHQLLAYDEQTRKKLWSTRHLFTTSLQTETVVVNGHVYRPRSGMYAFGSDDGSAPRNRGTVSRGRGVRSPGATTAAPSRTRVIRAVEDQSRRPSGRPSAAPSPPRGAPSTPNDQRRLVALTEKTASSPSAPR